VSEQEERDVPVQMIVCPPGEAYVGARDLAAHNLTAPADLARARMQHAALRQTLTDCGVEVLRVEELTGHPNSVFVQDTALATPAGFIRLRMGLPSRRGEPAWMAAALMGWGVPEMSRITAPGTVEGGDVILADDVAFVGRSSRTNDVGIAQLRALLAPQGFTLRVTDVPPPSLHIGGMMSLVGPRQVLACRGVFPSGFFDDFEVVWVPKTNFISGNVITVSAGHVIAGARNVEAIGALQRAGFTVHPLDLSEFVKGTGGPSCLILPL
jgi:dimethylargininase